MTIRTSSPETLIALPEIPEHLQEYITDQDPDLYTSEDHAAWRFIMRVSKNFFKKHAHPLYMTGLDATGISTDRIPLVSEMDAALKKLGWRAVVINGFIPPSVFLEFQSLKILAIACDMRKIENLGYTPSPDIVHEAAGHAPIVCDPKYREYLEAYGQVARNAIISKQDLELYDAIFILSETKENPNSTPEQIAAAQKKFEETAQKITEPSEAALLARMAWWTTEYGLIEMNGKPLIYGAGLLSSVHESHHSIHDGVRKINFTLDSAIHTAYDITRPQPQLFVTQSFEDLTHSLEQFANNMSFRMGGGYGLSVAQKAENTVTVVLDSGMQITGTVKSFEESDQHEIFNFTLTDRKQFSYQEQALSEPSDRDFAKQITFPLFHESIAAVSLDDLLKKLHGSGLRTRDGGRITGRFKKEYRLGSGGRLILLEKTKLFRADGSVVFEEYAKPFPLILGSKIVSVFGGAADRKEFALRSSTNLKKVSIHKSNYQESKAPLYSAFSRIRQLRESSRMDPVELETLTELAKSKFPNEWLLHLELLELHQQFGRFPHAVQFLSQHLKSLAQLKDAFAEPIQMGLELLK